MSDDADDGRTNSAPSIERGERSFLNAWNVLCAREVELREAAKTQKERIRVLEASIYRIRSSLTRNFANGEPQFRSVMEACISAIELIEETT